MVDDHVNDDAVGYGKPPLHGRFRKGQSGNPSGRPKRARNLATDLAAELSERTSVPEGNRNRRVSKQRAILKTLTARAIKGDAKATATILDLLRTLPGLDPDPEPAPDAQGDDDPSERPPGAKERLLAKLDKMAERMRATEEYEARARAVAGPHLGEGADNDDANAGVPDAPAAVYQGPQCRSL